jgi:glycosyltransferase involved in cell wall biosynthesis
VSVAVIIATYGDERWSDLAWSHAFDSVRDQDCTTIVNHSPDGTLASSRNYAAGQVDTDWLCFLDADDQLAPDYVETMMRVAPRLDPWVESPFGPGRDSLLVPRIQYMHGGRPQGPPAIPAWGRPLIEINCAVIGTLVPRRLFEAVGGFRELPMYEDWDVWLRCVLAGAVMIPVEETCYCATVSVGRNAKPEAIETYWKIRSEHEEAYARLA